MVSEYRASFDISVKSISYRAQEKAIDLSVTISNTSCVSKGNERPLDMSSFSSESRPTEITTIVVLIAILILLPPVLNLWGASSNVWYMPYLVWFGIILLSYWLQRILRKHAI